MISPSAVRAVTLQLGRERLAFGDQRMIAPHLAGIGESRRTRPGRRARSARSCRASGAARASPCRRRPRRSPDDRGTRPAPESFRQRRGSSRSRSPPAAACPGPAKCTGASARAPCGRDRQGVVAMHDHFRAQHHECLHQIVGEGIVVIDQQQARAHSPSSASRKACTAAALLASTSSCSASGWLSATMPGAGLVAVLIAVKHQRADRDRLIHVAARAEVAHRAAVESAAHRLEFLDDLHGAHLGRAHQRAGRKGRGKQVEGIAARRPVAPARR